MDIQIDRDLIAREVRRELTGNLDRAGRKLVAGVRRRSPDDTGELDGSYTHEVEDGPDGVRLLVGTPLPKGRPIELGTRRMAPRAPLRRTLAEDGDAALGIIAGR